jgi:formylglycine-generating enzyme required for sulfatase activity
MTLCFVDGEKTSNFSAEDFPLALGLSSDRSLAVGVEAETAPVAWITLHEGRFSLQSERTRIPFSYDGAVPAGAVWLAEGGEIEIAGRVIDVSVSGGACRLALRPAVAAESVETVAEAPEAAADTDDMKFERFGTKFGESSRAAGFGLSKSAKISLGLFASLLLAVVYVLVSSPVYLQIVPAPQKASLSGFPPPVPVLDRYLALPGTYTVTASAPGFKPLEEKVTVGFGQSPTFAFQLRILPGLLSVTTPPIEGATILVDGKEAGKSPAGDIEVDAGKREIRIVSERYLPETRMIDVRGRGERQALDIPLLPGWGTVEVQSVPAQATVRLGGKPVGETPLTFQPLQGVHELEISKSGWKTVRQRVEIKAGQTAALAPIRMEKIDGTIDLSTSPAEATITVDGQFKGRSPLAFPLVSDRDYVLRITKAGYIGVTRTVRVEGDKTMPLSVALKPELGTVFIAAVPADATLSINGTQRGRATQRLSLQTLPQAIVVSKPGYVPFRTTVTPHAGVSRTINVALKTVGQDLLDKDAKGVRTKGGQRIRLMFLDGPQRLMLGAPRRDPGRRSNEPEHLVELTRSFWISEKEVTNTEFRKFRPSHASGTYQGKSLNDAAQPVVNVSWDDAARYANWLSGQEKLAPAYRESGGRMVPVLPVTNGYRLPSEAEWEYVARYDAGRRSLAQPRRFPWGDSMPPAARSGNYADDALPRLPFAIGGYVDGYSVTAPVGKFPANVAGLYDLGGNVAEWCHDYYDVNLSASASPKRDPLGPDSGRFHVIKGASWRSGTITDLRLSYRDYAEKPRDDIGFRIVRYAEIPGK